MRRLRDGDTTQTRSAVLGHAEVVTDPRAVARSLVLQADDFGDPDWHADAAPGDPERDPVGIADILLGDDVPETAIRAAADSDRFVRAPGAAAFSASLLMHRPDEATEAWHLLSSSEFAHGFAQSVAGAVTPRPGDLEVLAITTDAIASGSAVSVCDESSTHRSVLSAGSSVGMTPIHLDTLTLRHRTAIVLVWLLDSPDPISTVERARVLERIGGRLTQLI